MNIKKLLDHLKSEDGAEASAAFDKLHRNISIVKNHVYAAAKSEKDSRTRGALVEFLGDSKDPKYIKFLAVKLRHDNAIVKFWAFVALSRIATPEAIAIRDEYRFKDLAKNLREELSRECKPRSRRAHS